jgi:hypothetical protein
MIWRHPLAMIYLRIYTMVNINFTLEDDSSLDEDALEKFIEIKAASSDSSNKNALQSRERLETLLEDRRLP